MEVVVEVVVEAEVEVEAWAQAWGACPGNEVAVVEGAAPEAAECLWEEVDVVVWATFMDLIHREDTTAETHTPTTPRTRVSIPWGTIMASGLAMRGMDMADMDVVEVDMEEEAIMHTNLTKTTIRLALTESEKDFGYDYVC